MKRSIVENPPLDMLEEKKPNTERDSLNVELFVQPRLVFLFHVSHGQVSCYRAHISILYGQLCSDHSGNQPLKIQCGILCKNVEDHRAGWGMSRP